MAKEVSAVRLTAFKTDPTAEVVKLDPYKTYDLVELSKTKPAVDKLAAAAVKEIPGLSEKAKVLGVSTKSLTDEVLDGVFDKEAGIMVMQKVGYETSKDLLAPVMNAAKEFYEWSGLKDLVDFVTEAIEFVKFIIALIPCDSGSNDAAKAGTALAKHKSNLDWIDCLINFVKNTIRAVIKTVTNGLMSIVGGLLKVANALTFGLLSVAFHLAGYLTLDNILSIVALVKANDPKLVKIINKDDGKDRSVVLTLVNDNSNIDSSISIIGNIGVSNVNTVINVRNGIGDTDGAIVAELLNLMLNVPNAIAVDLLSDMRDPSVTVNPIILEDPVKDLYDAVILHGIDAIDLLLTTFNNDADISALLAVNNDISNVSPAVYSEILDVLSTLGVVDTLEMLELINAIGVEHTTTLLEAKELLGPNMQLVLDNSDVVKERIELLDLYVGSTLGITHADHVETAKLIVGGLNDDILSDLQLLIYTGINRADVYAVMDAISGDFGRISTADVNIVIDAVDTYGIDTITELLNFLYANGDSNDPQYLELFTILDTTTVTEITRLYDLYGHSRMLRLANVCGNVPGLQINDILVYTDSLSDSKFAMAKEIALLLSLFTDEEILKIVGLSDAMDQDLEFIQSIDPKAREIMGKAIDDADLILLLKRLNLPPLLESATMYAGIRMLIDNNQPEQIAEILRVFKIPATGNYRRLITAEILERYSKKNRDMNTSIQVVSKEFVDLLLSIYPDILGNNGVVDRTPFIKASADALDVLYYDTRTRAISVVETFN